MDILPEGFPQLLAAAPQMVQCWILMTSPILVAAAVVRNVRGEILLVRKRATTQFMLPGGKIDSGETAFGALERELSEELRLWVRVS